MIQPPSQDELLDNAIESFEMAIRNNLATKIEDYLPFGPLRIPVLVELVRIDIETRWSNRCPSTLDSYLNRFPELRASGLFQEIAFEDYRQRIDSGQPADPSEYQQRFGVEVASWPKSGGSSDLPSPEKNQPLADHSTHGRRADHPPSAYTQDDASSRSNQKKQLVTVDASPKTIVVDHDPAADLEKYLSEYPDKSARIRQATQEMPKPGDEFLGFRIIDELGSGAFGRVFLGLQKDLSDRPVALKVSADLRSEVKKLARLQHSNIVPVYSVHRTDSLQVLCMPYFGGVTLADVLRRLGKQTQSPESGRSIVTTIQDRKSQTIKVFAVRAPCANRPAPELPAFTEGEGLFKLERMGYRSAVLWIGMQLADALEHAHTRGLVHRDIKPANILIADDGRPMLLDFNLAEEVTIDAAERARVGGTLPYMSPEHLTAFHRKHGSVDPRSDLYSLGLVLYQLFTLKFPFPLYSGKASTVVDRMLQDRMKGPSPLRQSRPDVTPAEQAIIEKCLAPRVEDRYQSAAQLREDLDRQLHDLPLKFATNPCQRERCGKWLRRNPWSTSPAMIACTASFLVLIATVFGVRYNLAARTRQQDSDRSAALANYEQFFQLAEQAKNGLSGDREESITAVRVGLSALERIGADKDDWKDGPAVTLLPDAIRGRIDQEVAELAFLMTRAAVLTPEATGSTERLGGLARQGLDRQVIPLLTGRFETSNSDRIGIPADVMTEFRKLTREGSRASFLKACELAASYRHSESLRLVEVHLDKNPQDFPAWYLKARCLDQLDLIEPALTAYSTCIALRPTFARAYLGRGAIFLGRAKQPIQALADFDRAISLDEHLVEARINRALALRAMKRLPDALAELDGVLSRPNAPARVWFLRALLRDAHGDKAGAKADRMEGMKTQPKDPSGWVARGMARAEQDPGAALEDFRAAEKLDPSSIDAITNQAWILGEKLNRPVEAIEATNRLLKIRPDNLNARGGKAVLLARMGKTNEAIAEAKRCVESAAGPSAYYHAACVYAVASKNDPRYRSEAVRLVAKALMHGFGQDYVDHDRDLDPLRYDADFQKMAEGVKTILSLGKAVR